MAIHILIPTFMIFIVTPGLLESWGAIIVTKTTVGGEQDLPTVGDLNDAPLLKGD